MLPEIDSISHRRRALGLTQTQLAKKAEVSQSYIAKLEARKIEPSYTRIRSILKVLNGLERGNEKKAEEIMSKEIVNIQMDDLIRKTMDIMWDTGFSQIPVMDGERPVGSITERTIIDTMRNGRIEIPMGEQSISTIMDEPFPQVGEAAPISIIAELLRNYPAIIVQRRDKITGIITKADLLKTL
ncbi:transcriptional regulator [Candidatus Bathyarchaeota archaeon]|jgi:predicted transcriptional regulator|nr:transcriptional regulator [Candidatus Bathyarchaeota archaeon]MDP6047909.1 CBS domain-containing protein [Candidatus Bathyarchaeota archaeon]MDP7207230.1 CBS domain-containing protein [Candidatus Bathyarchaeota archaeon]|tara:strand:+ start:50 stop:604 length:555 start_codon:yes stop_codon:yes gene_type:complete